MEEAEVFRWPVKLTKYIDLFQGKMLPSIIVIVKESLFLTGQGFWWWQMCSHAEAQRWLPAGYFRRWAQEQNQHKNKQRTFVIPT